MRRGFLGVRNEDVALPAVPKGRRAATWPLAFPDWHPSTYLTVNHRGAQAGRATVFGRLHPSSRLPKNPGEALNTG